jgi:hypothetical protein
MTVEASVVLAIWLPKVSIPTLKVQENWLYINQKLYQHLIGMIGNEWWLIKSEIFKEI